MPEPFKNVTAPGDLAAPEQLGEAGMAQETSRLF